MCIGIPMQVRQSGLGYADCEGMGISRRVDTLLVGDQPPGTWLLVFLQSAREILSAEEAEKITRAIRAVDRVMENGGKALTGNPVDNDSIETLFADLIDREPPKPPSLLAREAQQKAEEQTTNHPATPLKDK